MKHAILTIINGKLGFLFTYWRIHEKGSGYVVSAVCVQRDR